MNRARAVHWLPAVLALGCAAHPPLPPELSGTEVADRILVSPRAGRELEQFAERPVLPTPPTPGEEPAEPPVFTLPDAVAFAMRNSPRLREAKAAIDRARGDELVAFAPFLPEVDFAYRFVDFSNPVQVTSQQIPAVIGFGAGSRDFSQGEMQLQWTLYDFGRTPGRYGRAVSREHVAALQAGRADQTVAYDVVAAYLRVLLAGAVKRVQVQAVKRAEAILADSRARRKGGVAERDDVLRAEVQVSEARELLVGAEQEEYDALARLNFTMGRNVSLPLTLVDWTDRPAFDRALTDCLQTALEQRRELAAAREAAAAAVQGLSAVKADYLPRLYVKGVAARIDGSGVLSGNSYGAGIHLDQAIFTGGRRLGGVRSARADVESAVASAQSVCDAVALEVNLAYRQIAAARERIKLAETATTQSRENLRLVTVRYNNGNATPTDVVDAETALTRSEQRLNSAVYGYLAALARLDYAMGTPQGNLTGLPPGAPGPAAEELPRPRPVP